MSAETLLTAAAAGALAASVMYALLFPVSRGRPLPPDVFAARILRNEPKLASVPGILVQLAFGVFWGAFFALTVDRIGTLGGSLSIHGLTVGVVAFFTSLSGFAALGLLRPPVDWRQWTGHFLNHLVFGLVLGLLMLLGGEA